MIIKKKLLHIISYGLLAAALLLFVGCGQKEKELGVGEHYYYPSQDTEASTEEAELKPYYLIVSNDTVAEELQLYSYENGLRYQYHYSLDTAFKDKFGGRSTAADFTVGRAVWIGELDENGRLEEIGISDRVWEYSNIRRFKTNPEEGKLQIADSLYSYGEDAFTFQKDMVVGLEAVTEDDILFVVGIDKKILSVNVTTGHGTIELVNTDLFEGSFLQLGNKIFVQITKDMKMDVQEGTYQLSVANDGWGGTTEVKIERGETLQIDLDKLKGDGPKYCDLEFKFDFTGAEVYIDSKKIDYSDAVSVKYGRHSLNIVVEGEKIWRRILYVNSAKATIFISSEDLENSSNSSNSSTENSQNTSQKTDTTQSNTSKQTENSSNSSNNTENSSNSDLTEYLTDYLSTLSTIF